MSRPTLLLLVALLTAIPYKPVGSYKGGAPLSACYSMSPDASSRFGHGAQSQTGESPYTVKIRDHLGAEVTEYQPGSFKTFRVSISGDKFVGFILQARSIGSLGVVRVGEFTHPLPTGAKYLNCDNGYKRVVTHRNNRTKFQSTFHWKPPKDNVGPIQFLATVVQSKRKYWTSLSSHQLYPSYGNVLDVSGNVSRCGRGFGCFRHGPELCTAQTCLSAVSWKCDATQKEVVFEAFVTQLQPHRSNYFAVGFSTDADLGKDDVVACAIHNGAISSDPFYYGQESYLESSHVSHRLLKSFVKGDDRFFCRFSRSLTAGYDLRLPQYLFFMWGNVDSNGDLRKPPKTNIFEVPHRTDLCSHPSFVGKIESPTNSGGPKPRLDWYGYAAVNFLLLRRTFGLNWSGLER